MKSHSLVSSLILSLAFGLVARAQPGTPEKATGSPTTPAAAPAAAPQPTFTEEQMLEEFGWFVAKRIGLAELDLNKDQITALIKGLNSGLDGKESPYELPVIGPAMDQFMQRKQAAFQAKAKEKSTAATAAFMTKLKENKNVTIQPNGLAYEIITPGTGPAPKPTDTVSVNYVGALTDGKVFDSSPKGQPAEFVLDQVIAGWTEGLQKISKGGKIKLYIPPELAYGDQNKPGIPASSTLVFDVDLLDIKPAMAAPAPAVPTPAAPEPTTK